MCSQNGLTMFLLRKKIMKYLISYDLHGVSPDVSCGLRQILGSTLLYETMGVESAKSVHDRIYRIIYTRFQNWTGADFDLIVGACPDLYCSCDERLQQSRIRSILSSAVRE